MEKKKRPEKTYSQGEFTNASELSFHKIRQELIITCDRGSYILNIKRN